MKVRYSATVIAPRVTANVMTRPARWLDERASLVLVQELRRWLIVAIAFIIGVVLQLGAWTLAAALVTAARHIS